MIDFSPMLNELRELKQLPNLKRMISDGKQTLANNRAYGNKMGNFNAPSTKYNTDAKFAKISIDAATKIKWAEAIAVDGGDELISVYGWVESCTGLKNFDDDKWSFEPCFCAVEIRKKTLEGTSKSGKAYKLESFPMGLAFIDALTTGDDAVGFGKPFQGLLDVSAGSEIALWLKGLPNGDGEVAEEAELAFIKKKMLVINPLEKLVHMEGATLPEGKQSRGSYGGGGGQKESAKLADRVTFLLQLAKGENPAGEELLSLVYGNDVATSKGILLATLVEQIFS